MDNDHFETKLQRLRRDLQYFNLILPNAQPHEKLEIYRQKLSVLTEINETVRRQTAKKNQENEYMKKAVEKLERAQNRPESD